MGFKEMDVVCSREIYTVMDDMVSTIMVEYLFAGFDSMLLAHSSRRFPNRTWTLDEGRTFSLWVVVWMVISCL